MEYKSPTIPYETLPEPNVSTSEMEEMRNRIITCLNLFGIAFTKINVTPGPVISFWEIFPDRGVKVSKIRDQKEMIEQSINIVGCRMMCPIPGKGTIGFEIPNKHPQKVTFNALVSTKDFIDAKMELPIALGVDRTGKPLIVDLAKMCHILITGATGIGKSITQHTIISSLLCKKSPQDLKLVLINTRRVEFDAYKNLDEYLAVPEHIEDPIIHQVHDGVETLESLCEVMQQRYVLLRKAEARNIKDYNKKVAAGKLTPSQHQHLPYIVVVIDEYADLLLTAGSHFELPLNRLAQLARAVGIHLVISTQRVKADVITATIKTNFPCYICCRTMSVRDSLIALNHPGAECLLGKGDMLFSCRQEPIRFQGAYIDEEEDVPNICQQIIKQSSNAKRYILPAAPESEKSDVKIGELQFTYADPLFEAAATFFVENQIVSTSMLQRQFSIGYNRAGRVMGMLEAAGIIESIDGSFQKRLLIHDLDTLKAHIAELKKKMVDKFLQESNI